MSVKDWLAEKAIRDCIIRYGLAADRGDIETALACHTPDAVYTVHNPDAGRKGRAGGELVLDGREAITDMLTSERHQSLIEQGCAHTVGPLIVTVNGDQATVEGYSRVYIQEDTGPRLFRVGFNVWMMERHNKDWLIASRESRAMGS